MTTALATINEALTTDAAEIVILCDCSGSMSERTPNGKRRYEVLRETLLTLAPKLLAHGGMKLYRFADRVQPMRTWDAQAFEGGDIGHGTNMAGALKKARRHNPAHIILITDGESNDHEATLQMADTLFSKLDVYFCGEHSHTRAVSLCSELTRYGGTCTVDPGGNNMLGAITLLLE